MPRITSLNVHLAEGENVQVRERGQHRWLELGESLAAPAVWFSGSDAPLIDKIAAVIAEHRAEVSGDALLAAGAMTAEGA